MADKLADASNDYLSAKEAATFLGVTRATLYSYVSRGMITSVSSVPGERTRKYLKADLLALRHRTSFRNDPAAAATQVIEYGAPILTTAISQITDSDHLYRDLSSRELAGRYSFEQVSEYLWTGRLEAGRDGPVLPAPSGHWHQELDPEILGRVTPDLSPAEQLQELLPLLGHTDLSAQGNRPEVLFPAATRALLYMVYLSSGQEYAHSIARTLAAAWSADARALDALLVMIADHELNIATFTARCIASAGATLHQALLGGLAALQGYKHLYGQVAEAKGFFAEVVTHGDPAGTVQRFMRQRGAIPGFHNPYRRLYSGHDPRVGTLTDLLAGTDHHGLLLDTLDKAAAATGERPRVDFLLAAAEVCLELPANSVFSIIALGRMSGMIAHIFEQYESESVIRPRARYTGK